MRVLVVCECSGRVREAFRKKGHDAWSCDLQASEDNSRHHFQENAQNGVMKLGWDLVIAHPTCTYLANSGERWIKGNCNRIVKRAIAVKFVKWLWESPIEKFVIENPIGHLSTAWRRLDQIIQPWGFGEPEYKSTCLWIRGLPLLMATDVVEPDLNRGGGKKPGRISSRIHRIGPGPERQKERSRTFQGIANAMAEQWG